MILRDHFVAKSPQRRVHPVSLTCGFFCPQISAAIGYGNRVGIPPNVRFCPLELFNGHRQQISPGDWSDRGSNDRHRLASVAASAGRGGCVANGGRDALARVGADRTTSEPTRSDPQDLCRRRHRRVPSTAAAARASRMSPHWPTRCRRLDPIRPTTRSHAKRSTISWNAIARLPANQATAIVMRCVQSESYEVIALALRCGTATARKHVARGRERLARSLRHLDFERLVHNRDV